MTMYKKLFLGLLLVQFIRKFDGIVSLQSPKNCEFVPKWPFLTRLVKFGQNKNFSQKKGSAIIFLPLLSHNSMPSFGKILGAVSEINYERTHGQG